jgi:hypothetical protein
MPENELASHRYPALVSRVYALLVHPRLPIIAALLAMVLVLPSLGGGWITDDYYHQYAILAPGNARQFFRSPMDMFRFLDGDPDRTHRLMDLGALPWWTYPGLKGAFWRPLTVQTHRLDYWLWPGSAVLMHAQSILWFGAVVAAVAFLYRRFMGTVWVAGAAAILYAIDDAHGMPVGFIANRNALLAVFFGVLAILAHDRWRRGGWRIGAVAGPFLLGLSLLSAEAGMGTCAYLAAHAFVVDRDRWWRRFAALTPYVVVVVVWRILWMNLGYGVLHASSYVDPISNPLRFMLYALRNAPILLLGQWATPPSDVVTLLGPAGANVLLLGAVAFLVVLAIALFPLLRIDRISRFWAVGMLLSLVPVCTTLPMDRLLFFVGIGGMGLLAKFFEAVFARPEWRPSSRAWRTVARPLGIAFVILHLIGAPLALPFRAGYSVAPEKFLAQFQVRTPLDSSVKDQDVVIVNAPNEWLAGFLPILRALHGEPGPRHTRILAPALCTLSVRRPDAHTLVIRPDKGFMCGLIDRSLRDRDYPMSVGERVELTGLTIEVTAVTADGRPAEARFRFAVPLDDPSLRWLQWKAGVFVPFTPPAIGQTVELRQPDRALWPLRSDAPVSSNAATAQKATTPAR